MTARNRLGGETWEVVLVAKPAPILPRDGVDRCDCGCKYWWGRQCVDCQELFEAGSPE